MKRLGNNLKNKNFKILRVTTVPQTLYNLLKPQLKDLKDEFEIVTVSGPFYHVKDVEYEEWPYRNYIIPLTRKINPFQDLKAIICLYRILRKERPDIIHTHTPKAGFVGMISSFLARVPVRLHTVAGTPITEINNIKKRKFLLMIEKITYACAHQVMPNSIGVMNFITQNKLSKPNKIKMLANGGTIGVDLEWYKKTPDLEKKAKNIKQNAHIDENDFVCCFIGRLTRQKGVEELISAFQEIFDTHSNIKLILLGRFEQHLDPIDEKFIKSIQNNKNIIHFGYQTDVRPFLVMSNLFVFPSYREGLPNVVLQAGSFNLPSIVTDIAGSNEIIKNGVNGIIIPAKKVEDIKQAVLYLISNKDVRNFMSENARREIEEKYDRNIIVQSIKNEYNKWLHEKIF